LKYAVVTPVYFKKVTTLFKGISSITYNSLNLPHTVNISNSINTYVYSAMGTKLSVSQPNKKTDYVGSMIYENNTLKHILVDGGYYEPSTSKSFLSYPVNVRIF